MSLRLVDIYSRVGNLSTVTPVGQTGAVELRWEAPGPGVWRLLPEHVPRPVSRLMLDLLPLASAGWPQGAARFGLPMGETRWAGANGWVYVQRDPAPPAGEELERAAEAALAGRAWRDVVRAWHAERRPAVVAGNRALQAVALGPLGDADLAGHLAGTIANVAAVAPDHFAHMAPFSVAAGLLLSATRGWRIEPAAVLALLAGHSPASRAASDQLARVAAALGDRRASSYAAVRAAGPGAAAALDAFLDEHGWRVVYDVAEPSRGERPDLVLAAVGAAAARGPGGRAAPPDRSAAVRDRVPAGERDRFDELLADARDCYRLRDDDGGVCYGWPFGLVRRAALEAGRRLEGRGRLVDAGDVFEASQAEIAALLAGDGPPAADLAARAARRRAAASVTPPPALGAPDAGGGPGGEGPVPPHVARVQAAQAACWALGAPAVGGTGGTLRGVGVGDGAHTGPALVVTGTGQELGALCPGHVLVAATTTAADDPLFAVVGAVATEHGSLLGHAAITAREHGLPAVVGVAGLLDAVAPGALVEVDAAAGTVRVVP